MCLPEQTETTEINHHNTKVPLHWSHYHYSVKLEQKKIQQNEILKCMTD